MQRAQLNADALNRLAPVPVQTQLQLLPRTTRAQLVLNVDLTPRVQIESPDSMPEFKDVLTPWFSMQLDGPPCRPGVFQTKRKVNGATAYTWKLWSGVCWYEGGLTRAAAAGSTVVTGPDEQPDAYRGIMIPEAIKVEMRALGAFGDRMVDSSDGAAT